MDNNLDIFAVADNKPGLNAEAPPVKENQSCQITQNSGIFVMTPEKLLQGIIYSEILGKPKGLRRYRGK